MKLKQITLLALTCAISLATFPANSDTVVIIGKRPASPALMPEMNDSNVTNPNQNGGGGETEVAQLWGIKPEVLERMSDVRCAPNQSYANYTSRTDAEVRFGAATALIGAILLIDGRAFSL